jgi:hypothetical protein
MLAVSVRLAENLRRSRDNSALSLHTLAQEASVERKYLRGLEAGPVKTGVRGSLPARKQDLYPCPRDGSTFTLQEI